MCSPATCFYLQAQCRTHIFYASITVSDDSYKLQIFVCKKDVGFKAAGKRADRALCADAFCRIEGCGFYRAGKGNTEAHGISHAIEEVGCRSRNRAIGQRRTAPFLGDHLAAQFIFPIGHSCGAHSIADQNDPVVSEQLKSAADNGRMDVDSIAAKAKALAARKRH